MKLFTIKEALQLTDLAQLNQQIKLRYQAQIKMVGNLYPSILESEIDRLRDRIRELETGAVHLKMKPGSDAYRAAARSLALSYCPPIYPCKKCGHPVFLGYLCGCGSSADEGYESFRD